MVKHIPVKLPEEKQWESEAINGRADALFLVLVKVSKDRVREGE